MNIGNPFALSVTDLADALDRLKAEVNRRSLLTTANHDEAAIIKGHEYAKRAIIVAAVGRHSMLFVGGPFGKTLLRALAHRLGVTETFEARPCSCGFMGDSLNPCMCTIEQIEAQTATHPVAEVFVEVIRVPEFEMAAANGNYHRDDARTNPFSKPTANKHHLGEQCEIDPEKRR